MIGLFVPVGFLLLASLVTLSSIALSNFYLQLLWVVTGSLIVLFFYFVDWRALLNHKWAVWGLYALAVFLLLVVALEGPVIRNTRGWLVLGPRNFQPVELAKIALIFAYAYYFSRRHVSIARWKNIIASFIYFVIPAALVMAQPDLGSALVLFGIWFGFLLVSGLPRRRLFFALVVFSLAGIFMWNYGLKDYQRARIVGIFYPEQNTLGINYSVAQSKIAIGSAGLWGKGYGQGTQTQLAFLPEPATDFILPAFIEEWGLIPGFLVIAAFLGIIFFILKIGILADQNFEKFICLGSAMMFTWQFFLNVGSATGIFPVVGVPFPFLSYGGSSLLTSFFLIAIINAIALRS